ncbi:type VI secretion system tip protein VgrG, partial [Brenneria populi]|nr:type VI secretion system tip protein VgrG [Brenneria populi Li et al. 2015]
GSSDYNAPAPELPSGFSEFFVARDEDSGEILPFKRYRITTSEGDVYEGYTDAEGKTAEVFTAIPEKINIEFI